MLMDLALYSKPLTPSTSGDSVHVKKAVLDLLLAFHDIQPGAERPIYAIQIKE